jgi:hypothetical protein
VKAIRTGQWQLAADKFLHIEIIDGEQFVRSLVPLRARGIICVFVLLKDDEMDEFYVFTTEELQDIILRTYRGGRRPRNPSSTHCTVSRQQLKPFRDNSKLLTSGGSAAPAVAA